MVDQSKRRTLKLMSGAGTAVVAGSAVVGGVALSNPAVATAIGPYNRADAASPAAAHSASNGLNIQIITGRSTPEDSVIFTNDSNAEIVIREFLPGLVTQNDQMMDLNTLLANGDLVVKPGYPVASRSISWEPLSLQASSSYLWCDTAVSKLSDNTDTGVISINVAVVNGRALLTAEHNQIAFS